MSFICSEAESGHLGAAKSRTSAAVTMMESHATAGNTNRETIVLWLRTFYCSPVLATYNSTSQASTMAATAALQQQLVGRRLSSSRPRRCQPAVAASADLVSRAQLKPLCSWRRHPRRAAAPLRANGGGSRHPHFGTSDDEDFPAMPPLPLPGVPDLPAGDESPLAPELRTSHEYESVEQARGLPPESTAGACNWPSE